MLDGKARQVMLSVRELNTESMPTRSWVNERLTFTHGYGLTLGPVNQVTTEGLPVLFVRDIPPVSTVDLRVDRAERLLRGVVEHIRPRQDATARVPLSARRSHWRGRGRGRRGLRDDVLHRVGWRAGGIAPAPADVRHSLPQHGHSRQQPDHRREPDHVPPADRRARARARAVPHLRCGSVSGAERRPDVLDAGRVHDDGPVPVLHASPPASAGDQLHSELREDRDRRVQRVRLVLSGRSGRSAGADPGEHLPRACFIRSTTCPRICGVTSGTPKTCSGRRRRCTRRTT